MTTRSLSKAERQFLELHRLRDDSRRLYRAMLKDKSYNAALAWQRSLRRVRELFDEIKPVIVT